MSARRKARKRALDILFSADINGQLLEEALESARHRAQLEPERGSSWAYAEHMVQGIVDHREDIDGLLRATSQSWPLERMPAVDRAVLRLATWEMLHNPEVPAAVAISEALELVNEFSTEASAGFVHGVLSSISGQSEAP